ncbi:MAG: hypothetical protein A2X28_11290 [Elusimicrobia bacterium GWA2_56_46]|nr:MAG: hypothetical protein A2X28_11290 [Elusimicrobia bacterium GWA2_56_46]OGR54521.1 MAG: hypothetical protein A2X39_10075 [Elusimicrobia bacterium GWC2_56_31]HBB68192.1 hypothetical protein [Elusimicrobiota bacterium]HBW22323.1 hypothetical protein [Elusimicrobiota bacterium]
MRLMGHAAAGAGLGALVYQATADWRLAGVAAGTEVFVDLDHVLEHLFRSDRPLCLKTFFSRRNSLDWPKMVFIFHAYEWVVLLAVAAAYFASPLLWAAALGAVVHLFLDEIGNRRFIYPGYFALGFYFFSYRLFRGFRVEKLIREAGGDRQ